MHPISIAGAFVFKLISKSERTAAAIRLVLMTWVAFCAGCTGTAEIQFVSLHVNEIDPPPAKSQRYDAQEAYWWIDEKKDLNIAMRCRRRNVFLGRLGELELMMSLVPGPPPAGSGRNYTVRQRETRTTLSSGLQFQRFTSYAGIMTVIVDDDKHLKGSFRIWMRPHKQIDFFSFIPRTPGSVLCFGTFNAVLDEARGKTIRQACESGGWERRSGAKSPTNARPKKSTRKQPSRISR